MKHYLNKKSLSLLLLIPTFIFLFYLSKAESKPTEMKGYSTVTKGDVVQQTTVAGVVLPNRKTLIIPPYAGYVKKIYVTVGQNVKQGDPIVSLVQNLRDIHDESFPLRSPFGGTVVQVSKSEGEFVEANKQSALVRIDDLSSLYVLSDVPESDMAKLSLGQEVGVKVNGLPDVSYHGKIIDIAQAPNEKEGGWGRPGERVEYQVKAVITDKDDRIRSGMSTLVDIITAKKVSVLTLPLECVEKRGNDYFVTLENGKQKPVKVGIQNDSLFEIKEGLNENDKVKMVDYYNLNPKM